MPGISAFQKAASVLGAPIGHDMCIISLSDLMTPWEVIERRIKAAAVGDFVTAVYNPKSHGRYWQLYRLQELFLKHRSADTPVGYVRQAGREEQEIKVTTLKAFDPEDVDMFTVILIGNSQSYIADGKIITPRGYYREELKNGKVEELKLGQNIMIESFRTISGELRRKDYPLDHLWALLHAIHTTADFDMERILYTDEHAVETLYNKVKDGSLKTIVTDVTMVTSGIRKGALQRLGVEAKCYLSDPRVAEMASNEGITRTQAGIHLAVEEHPDALFAFGNAPTALMELCDLIRKGKAHPAGIIAAPVGTILAVNALLLQLYLLFSYIMDGFAYAGEALGGRFWGARNGQAFREVVGRLFVWGAGMTVLFTILYVVGGMSFLRLLTDEDSVVSAAREFVWWAYLIPVAGVAAFVWDGIFIGITQTRGMLLSAALASVVFLAGVTWLMPLMGNHGLWLSMLLYLAVRGAVQSVIYRKRCLIIDN